MSPSLKHFLRHYGVLTDIRILMAAEHVVMLLAMAGVMLLRPDEYIHHHLARVTA